MDDILQCYKALDLEPGVPAEHVRRSYIELTQVWDPEHFVGNPVLRARAAEKRRQIDEAYQAISAFLPELHSSSKEEKTAAPERDFIELSREPPVETSRKILGILVAIVLLFIFGWAFFLLIKGRSAYAPAVPLE